MTILSYILNAYSWDAVDLGTFQNVLLLLGKTTLKEKT